MLLVIFIISQGAFIQTPQLIVPLSEHYLHVCHYSATLLHQPAWAFFISKGVHWTPLELTALQATFSQSCKVLSLVRGIPGSWIKVWRHCPAGSNRFSVIFFCMRQELLDPAKHLPIAAGASVHHEEQNQQPGWSHCFCEKQRLPDAALNCALISTAA